MSVLLKMSLVLSSQSESERKEKAWHGIAIQGLISEKFLENQFKNSWNPDICY